LILNKKTYFCRYNIHEMDNNKSDIKRTSKNFDDEQKELDLLSNSGEEDNSSVYDCVTRADLGTESVAIYNNKFLSRGFSTKTNNDIPLSENYCDSCCKLSAYDSLIDIPKAADGVLYKVVEVRFKNSRKEFFKIDDDQEYNVGDIVAVESNPGHDLGIICLTGISALNQCKRKGIDPDSPEMKKIYRKARLSDLEKWAKFIVKEDENLILTRKIAQDLNLDMKMNDVEYQGDGTKAIFYYTAEDRVDFRELIKVFAEKFRVRIEMRQIGVRQEAARVGGIGSCGRELCCSTWMSTFNSVTTNVARVQQISINPQKIAGQCGKLKCCLNYEYETYLKELERFPEEKTVLKTKNGDAYHHKNDVIKELVWYHYKDDPTHLYAIPLKQVERIVKINKKGRKSDNLEKFAITNHKVNDYNLEIESDDLQRFDENLED